MHLLATHRKKNLRLLFKIFVFDFKPSCKGHAHRAWLKGPRQRVNFLLGTRVPSDVNQFCFGWDNFLTYQYLINIKLLFWTFWYQNYKFLSLWCNYVISKRDLFEENNCFVSNLLKTYISFGPLLFPAFFVKM